MTMINRHPAGWDHDLQQQLQHWQTQFPQCHVFALLDGAHDESCHALLKQTGSLPFRALYADMPHADEETFALSPLLVEYRPEHERTWLSLLQRTDGLPALSLIVTPESLSQLAHRLGPWCIVDADGQPLALSFADTRVLPGLIATLTPGQWRQLCGPTRVWQYVARDGGWQALPVPDRAELAADNVVLDARQCAALIAAAEPDHLLFQLRATGTTLAAGITPALAHEMLKFWLHCADHAQLDAAPERLALCEAGLAEPALFNHPQITDWLAQPSRPESIESLYRWWFPSPADTDERSSQ